jgi:hypothetical protein
LKDVAFCFSALDGADTKGGAFLMVKKRHLWRKFFVEK